MAYRITNVAMPLDSGSKKKTGMISLRLQEATEAAMADLMERHAVRNRTEYLHGLIYLDALLSGYPTWDLDKPAWVTRAFLHIFQNMDASRRVSAETQESLYSALRLILDKAPNEVLDAAITKLMDWADAIQVEEGKQDRQKPKTPPADKDINKDLKTDAEVFNRGTSAPGKRKKAG